MAKPKRKRVAKGNKAKDPNRVPLGSGLADRAKKELNARERRLQKAMEEAEGRQTTNRQNP